MKSMSQSYDYLNAADLSQPQLDRLRSSINLPLVEEKIKLFRRVALDQYPGARGVLKNTWKMEEFAEIRLQKLKAAREKAAAEAQRTQQEARFRRLVCMFVVAAKMAKADGRVDASEVKVVERLFAKFNISNNERPRYVDAFNIAVKNSEDVHWYAEKIAHDFPAETRLFVYELLWDVACADGVIVEAEFKLLKDLCSRLGLSDTVFYNNLRIRRDYYHGSSAGSSFSKEGHSQSEGRSKSSSRSTSGLGWAYALIGANANMTNDELKSAYRAQAKIYHPDVLRAKGIPEDLIEIANAKMVKLNEAWALIKKERGI